MVFFILGGLKGTPLSGLQQFGKTFMMRLGFSWAWNYATTSHIPMPVFDDFLSEAKTPQR